MVVFLWLCGLGLCVSPVHADCCFDCFIIDCYFYQTWLMQKKERKRRRRKKKQKT